jgi:hypothetical protein
MADQLDAALDLGWQFVAQFPCGGGLLILLARPQPAFKPERVLEAVGS